MHHIIFTIVPISESQIYASYALYLLKLTVDDERWSNFLLMMEIFCPNLCEDNAAYLSTLISDHHEQFSKLYPDDSIIPKMHFMVHMPRLIIQ